MYSFIHTLIHTYFISAFRSQLEKLSIEQLALITYTITSMPPPVEMLKPGSFQSSFVQLKLKQELYFNDIKFVVEIVQILIEMLKACSDKDTAVKSKTPMKLKQKSSEEVGDNDFLNKKESLSSSLSKVLHYLEFLNAALPPSISCLPHWRSLEGRSNLTNLISACAYQISSPDIDIHTMHSELVTYISKLQDTNSIDCSLSALFVEGMKKLLMNSMELQQILRIQRIQCLSKRIKTTLESKQIEDFTASMIMYISSAYIGVANNLGVDLDCCEEMLKILAVKEQSVLQLVKTQQIICQYELDRLGSLHVHMEGVNDSISANSLGPVVLLQVDISKKQSIINFISNIIKSTSQSLSISAHSLIRGLILLLRTFGFSAFKDIFDMFTNRNDKTCQKIYRKIPEQEMKLWQDLLEFCAVSSNYESMLEILIVDLDYRYDEENRNLIDALMRTVPEETKYHAALHLFLNEEMHIDALDRLIQIEQGGKFNPLILFVIHCYISFETLECRLVLFEKLCVLLKSCLSCRLKNDSSAIIENKKMVIDISLLQILDEFSVSMTSSYPLPYVLSPLYLVHKAVKAQRIEMAADLYWDIIFLPLSMLSPKISANRLKEDLNAKQMPFYFQKLEEVNLLQMGWNTCLWIIVE